MSLVSCKIFCVFREKVYYFERHNIYIIVIVTKMNEATPAPRVDFAAGEGKISIFVSDLVEISNIKVCEEHFLYFLSSYFSTNISSKLHILGQIGCDEKHKMQGEKCRNKNTRTWQKLL